MRVCHVITRLIVGGAQENTVDTVLGLAGDPSFEVELVSGPTPGGHAEGSLQSRVESRPGLLTVIADLVRPVSPPRDLRAFLALFRHFARRRPRIVHTHSGKAGVLGRLAARAARVPCIVHTIHGPSFGPFQGALGNALFGGAERLAALCTTHFVGVAHAMCRQYLDHGIGKEGMYTTIRSGFDIAPFLRAGNDPSLRRQLGIEPGDLVIGKVARMAPLKGHRDLIEAAGPILEACPRARFLLVGDGPLRPALQAMIEERNLSGRFVLAGLVPPDRVPGLVGIMDVLVHLSAREGLPRSLPQALAAARPVVAMDADGAREVCLDGRTGFLIRQGDTASLAKRVLLLAGDPGTRRRMGRSGRDLVRKDFAVERMVEGIAGLYHRLAGGPGGPRPSAAEPGSHALH